MAVVDGGGVVTGTGTSIEDTEVVVVAEVVAVEKVHDELWKDLFGVLERPVDVVTTRDNDGQMEGLVIYLYHAFCRSFRGRVRIAW
jgi:hypothetical protein